MAALNVSKITDPGVIAKIYQDPYISRVGHDHRAAGPIIDPLATYWGAYSDGQLVGAFLLIESGYIDVDVHALLFRDALPDSRLLGQLFLAEVFHNPEIQRATAQVIEGLESASNYCLRLGFKYEGFKRNACMRGGQLVGIHMLGMTRNEWEASV